MHLQQISVSCPSLLIRFVLVKPILHYQIDCEQGNGRWRGTFTNAILLRRCTCEFKATRNFFSLLLLGKQRQLSLSVQQEVSLRVGGTDVTATEHCQTTTTTARPEPRWSCQCGHTESCQSICAGKIKHKTLRGALPFAHGTKQDFVERNVVLYAQHAVRCR